jgi:hypothetical protein
VENFVSQAMFLSKDSCLPQNVFEFLTSTLFSAAAKFIVIPADHKELAKETSSPRPTGTAPGTVLYLKILVLQKIRGLCSGGSKKVSFSEKPLDLLLGPPGFLSNHNGAWGKATWTRS